MDQQWLSSIALSMAVAAIGFTLMGFFVGWGLAFIRLANQQPILEFEPRRPVPWTIVSLALAIFGFIVILTVASLVAFNIALPPPVVQVDTAAIAEPLPPGNEARSNVRPAPPANAPNNGPAKAANQPPNNQPPAPAKRAFPLIAIWLDSCVKLLFVVLAVAALLATGTTTRDLGLSLSHWKRDLVAGVLGFCMVAPLVLLLQGILVKLWQPSAHPLMESLRANMTLECWLAVTIAAVIGAPLFEEFAFRVLFQGWLERVVDSLPTLAAPTTQNAMVAAANRPAETAAVSANPYVSPASFIPSSQEPPPVERTSAGDVLPILISSLVFALMHYGHGPDWVSLIPFAGMLGFLYRRTHRIWPSVIAHFMLNGFSMTMLTVSLFWSGAIQKP